MKTKDFTPINNATEERILVIGGGPAGMMAAIAASNGGASVSLYERNATCGAKLLLTAHGRSNITHLGDDADFTLRYYDNGRFLWPALTSFSPQMLCNYFEDLGVKLTTDDYGRVLTAHGDAREIRDALEQAMQKAGVHVSTNNRVTALSCVENGYVVTSSRGHETYGAIIVATGGFTYPQTGSTGDGHSFASSLGLSLIEPTCALAPLYLDPTWFSALAGISLEHAELSFAKGGRKKGNHCFGGALLFTHKGLSGPVALNASHYLNDFPTKGELRLLPHLNAEEAFAVLLSSIKPNRLRKLTSFFPFANLPQNIWRTLLKELNLHQDHAGTYSHSALRQLVSLLVASPLVFTGKGDNRISMVTAGGISTKAIAPKTLEAKERKGLFVVGEVLDIDGESGGYNLQAAFSTGHLAGTSAAKYIKKHISTNRAKGNNA